MTEETIPAHLWQLTRQAAEGWERARVPLATAAIEPGHVLVLPEVEEPRVAWAVLRSEAEGDRHLLVAADLNPLVGSGDVAVAVPAIGPLTLRCRCTAWVYRQGLAAAVPMGALSAEDLASARGRWEATAAGRPVGTFSEQEADEDPEYQDWIDEVVRPAVAKLIAQIGAAEPNPAPPLPFPAPPPAAPKEEPRPPWRAAWLPWAALLAFLVLGAGGGWLWWRLGQEIQSLRAAAAASEAEHRRAIADLETRRAELQARYEAGLREAGEARARLEADYRRQRAELEAELARLRQATVVRNPLLAALDVSSAQRGRTTRLKVGPDVSHLVLLLPVDDPAGTEFHVEVYERRSGQLIVVQKGLKVDVLGEVRLGLPAVLLPPADYRLRLFRQEGGEPRLVREHVLDIDEERPRRPPRW